MQISTQLNRGKHLVHLLLIVETTLQLTNGEVDATISFQVPCPNLVAKVAE
jgi:hypothetical protein